MHLPAVLLALSLVSAIRALSTPPCRYLCQLSCADGDTVGMCMDYVECIGPDLECRKNSRMDCSLQGDDEALCNQCQEDCDCEVIAVR